ncbi:MAG: alpha/beta hydrolase [Gemmatimonadaceae bacterium]
MSSTATSHDVTVKGFAGNLSVNDGGNGSALPVLFAHSFAGSAEQWRPQLEHLRESRRAVAFDWRGHGQSDPSATNDYSIQAVADDIGVVADKLALNRFVLVGHSMGAAAAIAYAGSHADRVAGLLVEGAGGKMDDKMAKPMLEALENDYATKMTEYWVRLLDHATPATHALVKHDREVLNKETSLAMIRATFAYDPLPDLKKYDGPKLSVIARAGDTPFALHKLIPGLPVRIIDDSSHWTHLDQADEFNRILDEFLSTISG